MKDLTFDLYPVESIQCYNFVFKTFSTLVRYNFHDVAITFLYPWCNSCWFLRNILIHQDLWYSRSISLSSLPRPIPLMFTFEGYLPSCRFWFVSGIHIIFKSYWLSSILFRPFWLCVLINTFFDRLFYCIWRITIRIVISKLDILLRLLVFLAISLVLSKFISLSTLPLYKKSESLSSSSCSVSNQGMNTLLMNYHFLHLWHLIFHVVY